ncbi:flagellar biosynthetic protein FliO [Betaproteobacteria bacterium GR16-43]|nr:flagellar biosynthetic protein FliO [Betaproteobacteria bacterium GR16-43]
MNEAASPSLLGTVFSLAAVLALFVGAAWFAKRARGGSAARPAAHLRAVAQLSLGARERVVIVEAAGQWLVLGVAPGNVQHVATMAKPEGADAVAANPLPQAFAQVLSRFGGTNAR